MFMTLACATVIPNFKHLYRLYTGIKISSVGMCFLVRTKGSFRYENCLTFNFFVSLIYLWHFHVKTGDGVREKESNIDVHWRQENPNPRVHHSSGKLGKRRLSLFPTGMVDPRVGISCPHWTPMMDSICLTWPKEGTNPPGWETVQLRDVTLKHSVSSKKGEEIKPKFLFWDSLFKLYTGISGARWL